MSAGAVFSGVKWSSDLSEGAWVRGYLVVPSFGVVLPLGLFPVLGVVPAHGDVPALGLSLPLAVGV